MLIEKKKVNAFLIKNTFNWWTRLKKAQRLATVKQLNRKNSAVFEKSNKFFERMNVQIGFSPPSTVYFHLFFKDPLP